MTPAPAKKKRQTKGERMLKFAQHHTKENNWCALHILNNAQRYGGPDSLMVRWARMILNGYTRTPAEWHIAA